MNRRKILISGIVGGLATVTQSVKGQPGPGQSCFKTGQMDAGPFRTPYKIGRLIFQKSDSPDAFDSKLVDSASVFFHDDRLYMTYLGFDGIGYQTGLAVSDDAVNWKKLGTILRRDHNSRYMRYNAALGSILRDERLSSAGSLKKIDGKYLASWQAHPKPGYEQGAAVIGLAWSNNLMNWRIGEPILIAEKGAPWEQGGLYKSYLVLFDGVYHLYYNAKNATEWPWHEQWGVATSRDLKTWTRYPGNPLISNGVAGSDDEVFASDPFVLRNDDVWGAYYFGLGKDGHARELLALGSDPLHFDRTFERLIDVGPAGSLDAQFAHKPSAIYWKGDLYHFYTAVDGPGDIAQRGISVARSRKWDD